MATLGPYGVVFSGGGALGAWEVGCLRRLIRHHDDTYPEVMSGASAGALNAAGTALGMSPSVLEETWKNLRPDRVFAPHPPGRSFRALLTKVAMKSMSGSSVIKAVLGVASDLRSLYDAAPLTGTLDKELRPRWDDLSAFKGKVVFAVTNLTNNSRKYYYYPPNAVVATQNWQPITGYQVLRDALLASTAIPVLFAPKNDEVDGGVLHNQPLAAADHLLTAGKPIYVLIPQADRLPSALDLAALPGRLLQVWMSQGFVYELSRLAVRNIAAVGLNKPPRPVCVIRSAFDLAGEGSGLLKFGVAVERLVTRGEKDADAALASFDPANPKTWPQDLQTPKASYP